MRRLRIAAVICLFLLVVFTIAGFFLLPPLLVSVAARNLSQALHRQVTIQKVRFNPYTLVLEVHGLSVRDRGRPDSFVSFSSLIVDAQWSSVFEKAPVIREVRLSRPVVRIIRFEDNSYNFSDLMKRESGEKKGPLKFSVSNIQITGGTVIVDDRRVHKTHVAEDITLTIPFLSNMPHFSEVFVKPAFRAVINKTPISLQGRSKPYSTSLESTLTIDLKNVDVPAYLAYVPARPGFVLDSCLADLKATVTFLQFKDKRAPLSTVQGWVALRDISVREPGGAKILTLPAITVDVAPCEILQKKIHIRKIDIASPELTLDRNRKGALNLAQVLKKKAPTGPRPAGSRGQSAAIPVSIIVDEVVLSGGSVSYTDISGSSPVRIAAADVSLRAKDIFTDRVGGGSVDVGCILNRTCTLALKTSFSLRPPSADIALDLDGFQPAWVQPYVMERVPVLIRRGVLHAKGRVRLSRVENAPFGLNFTGDVRVTDFASIDRARAEDLVSWKDLFLTGIDFTLKPGRMNIAEIAITGPAGTYIMNADGTSNFSTLAGKQAKLARGAAPGPGAKKKALERIAVGRVSVRNGRFTFIDRTVTPKYTSSLRAISGTITSLSSDEFKKARVSLQARLDNQAPIVVTGAVNPLKDDLFVNLAASLKNMDLGALTPYSGKYAGLTIDKGKLSLDLNYVIDKKRLDARNRVLIDQLTFGRSVESPDATRLPVRLAVALLRDSSGRIDLNLPVTGRTDDPEFHVGKIILKIIVNILEKAATSPFALLEAMYPGAARLSHITFEPGRATLDDEAREKIAELVRILTERPSLNLEIRGFVDRERDREGLANTLFERKLKAQKVKDLLKTGRQAPFVDDVVLVPAEYSAYLARAYREEPFKKPSNFLGIPKTLPDNEMKRLIMEHITVTDDDLAGLASARARQVRDALAEAGSVDVSRIFLVEADAFKPEQIDTVPDRRVSLTLK